MIFHCTECQQACFCTTTPDEPPHCSQCGDTMRTDDD